MRTYWLCSLLVSFTALLSGDENVPGIVPGVSRELARYRAENISDIVYRLQFTIPEALLEPVRGSAVIEFSLKSASQALVVDFAGSKVDAVAVDGSPVEWELAQEHLLLPSRYMKNGPNQISVHFSAGDNSLNRNEEFLYTLFVPGRACTAFPCFDQPDLKARFHLVLETPATWAAVGNGRLLQDTTRNSRTLYRFEETCPLSTYLFAFVAGKFYKVTRSRGGRNISLYHRETDAQKVARNVGAIFDLSFESLRWMEGYTGIPCPFAKQDIVAVPFFQYSGMEHPGAILYRASRIFLDETATMEEKLKRANLIAHETAHLWFGDLVTMEWFDEVWLKEVFAGFMADKIVNPVFPDLDHRLRFLLGHYPFAYGIDRTEGTHPIEQELDNLRNAGTVYGNIIYHKAPVVMAHLEEMTGEENLRLGLSAYLKKFAYGNATWSDLIEILDEKTEADLESWSKIWVFSGGMPHIHTQLRRNADGTIAGLMISQTDPSGAGRVWPQHLTAWLFYGDEVKIVPFRLDRPSIELEELKGTPAPDFMLADGSGRGYGYFALEGPDADLLLANIGRIRDRTAQGQAWMCLWENMLHGRTSPAGLLTAILGALEKTEDELLAGLLLGYLKPLFWQYLDEKERHCSRIECRLWEILAGAKHSWKLACFQAYQTLALSEEAQGNLVEIWKRELSIPGLTLSENQYADLAMEIAVRGMPEAVEILEHTPIRNSDLEEQMAFLKPAVSADRAERDRFFDGLKNRRNRRREPLVEHALQYLHHPLRAQESRAYITPSLEMLEEIQSTGDIFFPTVWLTGTLSGHNSREAADAVSEFLKSRPGYPAHLKLKILQASDPLFRAVRILGKK